MPHNVLTVLLAGGKGTRLDPLTRDRAKPAVPFGGVYRIIDFTLSNCLNSGLRRVLVLTQFKSRSLEAHLRRGWAFLPSELGEGIEILPPQQRIDATWYKGTADALYQNIYSMEKLASTDVVVLAGDHVYKMDYRGMVNAHRESGAVATIGCVPVPLAEVNQFGVVLADSNGRVTGFREKPATAEPMPGDTKHALGSMGIYVFPTRMLFELLCEDAAEPASSNDFGKDVIPRLLAEGRTVQAYRFRGTDSAPHPYWRDVGTLDAYYEANMGLLAATPPLDLYDACWPVRTFHPQRPPVKLVGRGSAENSILSGGCVVAGTVVRGVLSPDVRIDADSRIEDAVLFDGVTVGRGCRIRHAIIDKGVRVPPGTVLGYDAGHDHRRGFTMSEAGVVLVAENTPAETFSDP